MGNILFYLDDLDRLPLDALYERLGKPVKTPVIRSDHRPLTSEAPEYTILPVVSGRPADEVADPQVMICDFGEAFRIEEGPKDTLHTPLGVLPPDILFDRGPAGLSADIWTLGCTIYDIMGNGVLLESYFPDPDDVMSEIVSMIGKPPDVYWYSWQSRNEFFRDDGSWNVAAHRYGGESRPLAQRVRENGRNNDEDWQQNEAPLLTELLSGMLRYEPESRVSMNEVASSKWVKAIKS